MKKTVAFILGLCMLFSTYGIAFSAVASEIAFTLSSFGETETRGIFGFSCVRSAFPTEIPQNTKISFARYSDNKLISADMRDFTEDVMYFDVEKGIDKITLFAWDFTTLKPLVSSYSLDIDLGIDDETEPKVKEVKGIVSGTYYTGLDAANVDISQAEIMIGIGEDKETYELSADLRKSIDFEDLIGKNVVAYYDKIDRQITQIMARNNTSTIIKEQDVISISGDTIKYYNENGRSDSVSLSGYTKIYNGKYYPAVDLATNFRNGTIELIEGGGQKVAKITSYQVFVVNNFDKTNEKIYFKYGKTFDNNNGSGMVNYYQFPARLSDKPIIYMNGVEKDFSSLSLSAYNVINYMESPRDTAGNKLKKIYVTTGAKTGKVTAGLDEVRMVEIDGEIIYLTMDYAEYNTGDGGSTEEKALFELGESYTYYLDYTGQIAAVKYSNVSAVYSYGYIIGADDELVRLILKDGTDVVVNMKKNVKVDGISTDRDEVKSRLESIARLIYPNESGCYQPVKYNITNSELTALDTVADSTGTQLATAVGSNSDDTFVYNGKEDSVTATTSKVTVGGNTYNFTRSTIVIYVPSDKSAVGDYSVMTPSTAFAVSANRKIEVLGAEPSERVKNATMVLIYGDNPIYTFTGKTPYMIVTKMMVNGEQYVITGYSEGTTTETTLTVSEDKFKKSAENCVDSSEVGKGDIIRYIKSGAEIVAIEMVYDADGRGKLGVEGDQMSFSAYTANVGELYMKYTEAVQVGECQQVYVTTAIGGTEEQILENLFTYKTNSSTAVYRAESSEIIAENLLANINTSVENPSEVIMITRSSTSTSTLTANAIYIVK